MKFSFLHKSVATVLSALVLFASISFTIEKHFCGDVLIDVAIFTNAEKCTMEAQDSDRYQITKKPCCKDEIDVIDGISESIYPSFKDLKTVEKYLITSFYLSYNAHIEHEDSSNNSYNYYLPPKLIEDRQLLYETFLI